MYDGADMLTIEDVPGESRSGLRPLLGECFTGIYLWHAMKTLRSVPWTRAASTGGAAAGVSMLSMLGRDLGYVYYIAVSPRHRGAGIGGRLLDDALQLLRRSGAREVLACIRPDNTSSIRLFRSRGFAQTGFAALARARGLLAAAALWARMVVAPGERVFSLARVDPAGPA